MPSYYKLKREPHAERIKAGPERLRDQLTHELPEKNLESSLLLATWNIREFDSPAYGPRVADAYYFIAEIVSRFDLVAVQEVRRNLSALDHLVGVLGWPWNYIVTDTTEGTAGNNERLAFLYDTRTVRFGGLAGELVLPPIETTVAGHKQSTAAAQLVRSPFTVAFSSGWTKFRLATVHIVYGDGRSDEPPERVAEIRELARFLAQRATEKERWTDNSVLLGDFNIADRSQATFSALTDEGWVIPRPLQAVPGTNVPANKHYDQIAVRPQTRWFEPTGHAACSTTTRAFSDEERTAYEADMGAPLLTTSKGTVRDDAAKQRYYRTYWRTFQMSDHLPMWLEIRTDYSSEYLAGLRAEPGPKPTPS